MKKILLFMALGVFLSMGLIAQDNVISGGDFESGADWDIAVLEWQESDISITFQNPSFTPKYGAGNNLRIHWEKTGSFELFIYQTIKLKVGSTYEFSGAFRDSGTDPESDYFWQQLILLPVGYAADLSGGPDWGIYGDKSPILLSMGVWGGADDDVCIGKDTTFTWPSHVYRGSFVNPDITTSNYGDTTVFTVPEIFPTAGDGLTLGDAGTEVDFFFALYMGQGGSSPGKLVDFTYDEFSLLETTSSNNIERKLASDHLSVYPNPVGEILNLSSELEINSVSIMNIIGQEVISVDNISHKTAEINTSGLNMGMYLISVTDASGKISSKKIIKK